jgi:gluconolactonase
MKNIYQRIHNKSENFKIKLLMRTSFAFMLLLIMIPGVIDAQTKKADIIAKGAKLQKLGGGYKFTEGPACDAKGNVYFSDQPNNTIIKWSTDGKLSVFSSNTGRANGLSFDKKGNLITCSDEKNELWSVAPDGKVTILLKEYNGKRLNAPNDIWIAPDEGIYFTDPFYKRSWWNYPMPEQDGEHVYYLAPDHSKLIRVTNDLITPNGIIGTPDGRFLYVADLGAKMTYRYKINPDGTLSGKKLFAEMGSDGMTIDNEGNIYLTGNGVTVFNPEGVQIAQIPVADERWVGNICFGGKDRHLLFITASTSVYGLKMKVKGVGSE